MEENKAKKGVRIVGLGPELQFVSRVARKGSVAKRTPEERPERSEEGGSHVDKPSCLICRAQCKMKI